MVMVLTTTREEALASESMMGSDATADLTPMQAAERRCLVTGVVQPKSKLIRFVLDPDQKIVPDLAARLPGRGLWVSANAEALKDVISKNIFARAAKTSVKANPQLVQLVEQLLAKRCLEFLGLARGAGLVVMGQLQVEQSVKDRELAFVLVAADAGQDGIKKLYHATIVESGFSRLQLGEALGREQLVYIGLKPHALTTKLQTELTRWQGVRIGSVSFSSKAQDSDQT